MSNLPAPSTLLNRYFTELRVVQLVAGNDRPSQLLDRPVPDLVR